MSTALEGLGGRWWRLVAPLVDLRLRPCVRHDASAPALILSPHLDDAVIDCWSVLTADFDVNPVNVCARSPDSGVATYWDRICGDGDSAALFRARLNEDREALALAGRTPVNLPFLEGQYRAGRRPPSLRELDEELSKRVAAASIVYAPATLGTVHPDHALVRSYALALVQHGVPARLYADLPYCGVYGWPAWVTGAAADPHLDVDAYWRASQKDRHICDRRSAEVVRLAEDDAAAKLVAMRTYRTQFSALDRGTIGMLSNSAVHSFELFWPLRNR